MHKKLCYIVNWLGYTPNGHTWEPIENNTPELVEDFHQCYPNKPSPKSRIVTRGSRLQSRG